MKTSEDALQSGLYVSGCCGEELVFCKGDSVWRCPRCQHLCEWELVEIAVFPHELERLQATETEPLFASRLEMSDFDRAFNHRY